MSEYLDELRKNFPPEFWHKSDEETAADQRSLLDLLFGAQVCDWYPPELRCGGREKLHGNHISMREWEKRHGRLVIK